MSSIAELTNSLKKEGKPVAPPRLGLRDEDPRELLKVGGDILVAEDQLALFRDELQATGYAGPTEVAELLHLAFMSRCLDRPINLAILGPSASGKTHTLKAVAKFHPDVAINMVSGGSNLSVAFSTRKTKHAYLVFTEARAIDVQGAGRAFLHELVWNQGEDEVTYDTVIWKDNDGPAPRTFSKKGPTGLVVTSIKGLPRELSTRMLQVEVQDAEQQTRAILDAVAEQAAGATVEPPDYKRWKKASRWLEQEGNSDIVVPYMGEVARHMPTDDVRLRRDIIQIVTLIRAHAFAHQVHRDRDDHDRVVAERVDYEVAHRLLAPVFETTQDEVRPSWRETWAVVEELNAERPADTKPGEGVTYQAVADASPTIETRGAAKRRCEPMIEEGYLRNLSNKYQDARLVLGRSLPEPRRTLPTPERVFERG